MILEHFPSKKSRLSRRATFNGRPLVCYCTGGCMRDLNAEDAPERSGVNGLCVDCYERESDPTPFPGDEMGDEIE